MSALILTHGGVGNPNRNSDGCVAACEAARDALSQPGLDAAISAVVKAGCYLEDDPRFNAGIGSNQRMDGSLQQDAILADDTGRFGAIAALDSTKNPILVAQALLETPHTLLAGDGADRFARARGFPSHDCTTEKSRRRLAGAQARLKNRDFRPTEKLWEGVDLKGQLHSTIGAVARTSDGRFAVSCSSGGTSMMLRGRVGDVPVFGAGVMVGPAGAVCATGDGEEIMRRTSSLRAYLRIEAGEDPQTVCDDMVREFPDPWMVGFIIVTRDRDGMAASDDVMSRARLEI